MLSSDTIVQLLFHQNTNYGNRTSYYNCQFILYVDINLRSRNWDIHIALKNSNFGDTFSKPKNTKFGTNNTFYYNLNTNHHPSNQPTTLVLKTNYGILSHFTFL